MQASIAKVAAIAGQIDHATLQLIILGRNLALVVQDNA